MASKADSKFGTFGGVFTPSILTILGVIMYLRLPWVVGNGGLLTTILIIAAAHVVSVCTGLSISSIATDKNVGAGGPYYIVSRSLGLPIGGTLGLALFLGLCFSISLYIIGFSESFLAAIEVEPTKNAIRVCGTLTVILLTVITFISTSLAIKTQYLILGLIGLSLVSIFLGSPETVASEPLIGAPEIGGEGIPVLFGIFFPAVTGFTAGVNMSGDLRDPKKAIPTGTMAAIGVGLLVYTVLAFFLAYRVPVEELQNNPRVFEDISLWAPAVTAGVWGATLSSALGSILGAPRILQTVSSDGITPRVFAVGFGKTNEPRNALLLAFLIGEAGILIAELDVIARVVSIVFMATYGFLNSAAAIEALVSPDFRPGFRIPKTVSVIGAVTCLLLMIQMDLAAMAGATVLMAVLFAYLQRRQLRLESGDAWSGVWSTLVRTGLHRLASAEKQQRNWRPNILLFRPDDGARHEALLRTAGSLITGNGMLTDVRLRGPDHKGGDARSGDAKDGDKPSSGLTDAGPVVGVFERIVECDEPLATIGAIAQFHGYSGVEPNTALLDWDGFHGGERFGAVIDELRAQDLNVLLFSDATHEPPAGVEPRVDVWWRAESSPALGISLIRFVGESAEYRRAAVRFLTVTRDSSIADALRNATRRMLVEARVTAEVEIVLDTVEPRSFEHHVEDRSADARLAIVELPPPPMEAALEALEAVSRAVPSVLYVAPSSAFEGAGRVVRATRTFEDELAQPSVDVGALELPPLELPDVVAIADEVERFDAKMAGVLTEFHAQSVRRLAARNVEIVQRTTALLDKHLGALAEGLEEANPVKQRRTVNRVQSAFLMDTSKLIDGVVQQDLADQRDILEGRLSALLEDRTLYDPDGRIEVERDAQDFAPTPGDSREVARVKAERGKSVRGGMVSYTLATGPLLAFYVERMLVEIVDELVRGSAHDAWHLAVTLGKIFNASRTSLTLIGGGASPDPAAAAAFVADERGRTRERMAEIEAALVEDADGLIEAALVHARELSRAYASDLLRVDVETFTRNKRKVARAMSAQRAALRDEPGVFYENQRALFDRAKIGLSVSAFQHRLATIVRRSEEAIALEVKNGVLHGYVELDKAFAEFMAEPTDEPLKAKLEVSHRFDPGSAIETLAREGQRSAEELVETIRTLSDASIHRLAEGDADEVEMVDLPLRRLAQFMLDAELIGPLTELLATVPSLEERAIGVGEDVVRLIGFHQAEYDEESSELSFYEHVLPVVENGRERIEKERAPLEEIVPTVREVLEEKLAAVLRGTDVYELTSSANKLGTQVRRRQGQRAVSGAQSFLMESGARVRRAVVSAVYGRSAGLLAARRLREGTGAGASVDRILAFVDDHHPSAGVLEDLPFYYRQLFFGKSTLGETFWVERDLELAAARRGIAQHERGGRGVIVITGEPDSGKTALARRLTGRALKAREVFRVAPPEAGVAELSRFVRALREATGQRGNLGQVLSSLDDGAVVVIEDLELWWDRGPEGLVVVDALMKAFERHSGRLLFVLEIGAHPFDLINRVRPLADHALSVVDCGPLPAEALKEIVMLRHGSTGLRFELEGVAESDLGEFSLARLFSNHFDYSRGLVGAALASWITHVERVEDGKLVVRMPGRRGWEVLDRLRPEWTALLVQLLLHKRLGRARLERISGLSAADLDQQLDALQRMGMVRASQKGVLSIDRFVTHALVERLRERRVIP